ncbi:MAG: diguanylate cyclase [Nitrospirae bacterium]|nr:diguanylate cyclase [Nitrospirota bacterium]MBI3350941.1 diguanylate cyclase [Nitrospirota bacterium]
MSGSFTTIVNHELFYYLLDLEVKRATRYSYFFSLLFIELDQEDDPDDTINMVAKLILNEIREVDIVGKIEKKRFSALLQAETKPTQTIAERIRGRILNYSFTDEAPAEKQRRTISVGGACFPTHGTDASELNSQALHLLEKARVDGGNRVYVHGMV